MAEILQSIERILAEDERPSASRTERTPPANSDEAEDVLELTEAVNADGTVRQLIPIGRVSRPKPPLADEPATITEIEAQPVEPAPRPEIEPIRPATVEPSAPVVAVSAGATAPEDVVVLPAVETSPSPHIVAPPAAETASTPHIVAPSAAETASTPHITEPMAGNLGSRTLEALVAELLRPMLKAWLDEHLPAVVERMVRSDAAPALDKSGKPADPG